MSIEMCLYKLALHVQDLLCCDGVSVLLGCAEPDLSHPLLQRLPTNSTTPYITATCSTMPPLQDESVAAVCDIACQTGTMWEASVRLSDNVSDKLIVLPLELPDGLLGLLLLSYKAPKDFSVGDFLRLQQCLPMVLQYLEKLLSHDRLTCGHEQDVAKVSKQYELVAEVSHELRVPLAVIKGYTALLQTYGYRDTSDEITVEAMLPEQRRCYLAAIMEQINYLEVLVSDLLDVSQLQTGHLALHPASVDIDTLCQSVIKQISYRADQQQPGCYTFRYQVEDELPAAWADQVRVRQVLINLLENAVKYSPNGGQIQIAVHTEQELGREENLEQTPHTSPSALAAKKICITIRDGGIGIARSQQATLFKAFARQEQSLTMGIAGHGLGLYISRKLVEAMHGQLFLTSKEGRGTCVTFTLPAGVPNIAVVSHEEQQEFYGAVRGQ
jgi:two-component system, OmpR family, sensor histidine kinase VicK